MLFPAATGPSIAKFIQNLRKQNELLKSKKAEIIGENQNHSDSNDEDISTQEMINEARARRHCSTKEFTCENCSYKSGSETLVKRHSEKEHIENKITPKIKTYTSKRLKCDHCSKKFNKNATYQKHMEKFHQEIKITSQNNIDHIINQNDLPNQMDEGQSRVTRQRNNKSV